MPFCPKKLKVFIDQLRTQNALPIALANVIYINGDINHVDANGKQAIDYIANRNDDLLSELLNWRVRPNHYRWLQYLTFAKKIELVEKIIKFWTVDHEACFEKPENVRVLSKLFYDAVECKHLSLVDQMLKRIKKLEIFAAVKEKKNVLHVCVERNHFSLFNRLLRCNKLKHLLDHKDDEDNTPFTRAILLNRKKFIKKLVALGYGPLDFLDSDNNNVLHLAAKAGSVELTTFFLFKGVKITENDDSANPFLIAVKQDQRQVIQHYLNLSSLSQLQLLDWEERSCFHIAAEKGLNKVFTILYQKKELRNLLTHQDVYGRTPEKIAILYGHELFLQAYYETLFEDLAVVACKMRDVKKLPEYNTGFLDRSQNNVNRILNLYLSGTGRDPKIINKILKGGQCNGWTYLFNLYGEKIYIIKEVIVRSEPFLSDLTAYPLVPALQSDIQDETMLFEQFQARTGLFQDACKAIGEHDDAQTFFAGVYRNGKEVKEALRRIYIKTNTKREHPLKAILIDLFEKYSSTEDLFERTIQNLFVFQFGNSFDTDLQVSLGAVFFDQETRKRQQELMGEERPREVMEQFYCAPNKMTLQQLEEYLRYFFHFNLRVEFGGGGHATGLILENGKMRYDDPNFRGPLKPFSHPKHLANVIYKTKYKRLNELHGHEFFMEFVVYSYRLSYEPYVPLCTPAIMNKMDPSPNDFNELHLAIMYKQYGALKFIVSGDPRYVKDLIFSNNNHGDCPLVFAFMHRDLLALSILKKFMDSIDIGIHTLFEKLNFATLHRCDENFLHLFLLEYFSFTFTDIYDRCVFTSKLGRWLASNPEVSVPIIAKMNAKINSQNYTVSCQESTIENVNLLGAMVLSQADPKVIEAILKHADFNPLLLSTADGRSSLLLAFQYKASRPLIHVLLQSARCNFQGKDNKGRTVLHYAIASKDIKLIEMTINYANNHYPNLLNQKDNDKLPPLHLALVEKCSAEIIQKIIENQYINVNLANSKGETALMYAIKHKMSLKIIQLIADRVDGDLGWVSANGFSYYDFAKKHPKGKAIVLTLERTKKSWQELVEQDAHQLCDAFQRSCLISNRLVNLRKRRAK